MITVSRVSDHVVTLTMDMVTGELLVQQHTLKEDAIFAIKEQPFYIAQEVSSE